MNKNLWAAVSVNQPIFRQGHVKLAFHFFVVNDGDTAINPGLKSTQLFINGKQFGDWPYISSNGPRDAKFTSLPPGESIEFTYALGDHFQKPGVYRISWKSADFQSPEIVFRVLPGK